MKAIILTFSKVNNFGANLQCYALSKVVERLGYDVEILDYQLSGSKSLNPIFRVSQFFQRRLFDKFRSRYFPPFTKKYSTHEELVSQCPQADIYIVGSDQVWNPQLTKEVGEETYFFDFLPSNAVKVAYAASFGIDKASYFEAFPNIPKYLSSFKSIGVREKSGQDICKKIAGLDVKLVVDPTILLGKFNQFHTEEKIKGVCLFNFQNTDYFYSSASYVAEVLKTSKFILASYRRRKGFKNKPVVSVEGWITNIGKSEFLLTDSFHATVLALLNHQEFVTFVMPNKSDRVFTLLNELGLTDRIIQSASDFDQRISSILNSRIDYDSIDKKLEKLRNESMNFLVNALR